jgi:hypothetical protein
MFDDTLATVVGTEIARFFNTDREAIPTLIKIIWLAQVFLGLAAISFTVNLWTMYRAVTQGKKP